MMDRLERFEYYLDIVPLPIVVAAAMLALLAFLAVPSRHRLHVSIVLLVPWLVLAQLRGLGPIQAVTKVSSIVPFALIALSAVIHPGPRRRLPAIVWLYPIMACVAFVYVLGVEERVLAFAMKLQWLALTVAAILVARTIVTADDLRRLASALTAGCFLSILFPLSAIVLYPGDSFLKGLGRFEPYGVNSNQIGILFALAFPLMVYMGLTTRRNLVKPMLLVAAALTVGMALITGSRQTMLAIGLVSLPLLWRFSRHPVLTVLAAVVGLGGVTWLIGLADTDAMSRFSSLDSERFAIWTDYAGVIARRPLFGLLGTQGLSVFKDDTVGMHPHNAYVEMLYVGGVSYALPMLLLVLYSLICTWRVWRERRRLGGDPLLISLLAMLLVAMYAQGLVNQVVYWPTYSWSFLHVILAGLFIALSRDMRWYGPEAALPDPYQVASAELEAAYDDELAYEPEPSLGPA